MTSRRDTRSPVGRAFLAAAAMLVALAVNASTAEAQTPDRGLFGIAPAKVLFSTRPPVNVQPLQVTNTTRRTYDVTVFVGPLHQASDGGLVYDPSANARRIGARSLRLGVKRFALAPGARRDLPMRWLRTLPNSRVAPMGVVVQGLPRGVNKSGGGVSTVYRLIGTYLLGLPGGRRDGRFVSLTAEQGAKRTLLFTATVRNTGASYDQPRRGRMTISDANGRAVSRASFKGELILPGSQRPFAVTTTKLLPAGKYTVTFTMLFGRSHKPRGIRKSFTLVGPNELPTTRLKIVDVKGFGYVGEDARVTVRVRNTGTRAAVANVRTALIEAPGGRRASKPSANRAASDLIELGKESTFTLDLGPLRDTDYQIDATALAQGSAFGTQTITITPRPKRSLAARIKRFVSDHAVVLIGVLAAIVLLAIAESTRRYRRRLRAQLQTEGNAVAPAAVARPNGRVDLNAAGADRLATVPGIGPGAAARIVAHRDEFGRFLAVTDLTKVDGFDQERVDLLEAQLEVH
jgi:competence ComEA-like helix-hairpin-helix protein